MGTARDLALVNGDLSIVGQDLAPLVADGPAIISDVNAALLAVQGEWFLDQSVGVNYFAAFRTKGDAALNALRAAVFAKVASRPGITSVASVTVARTPNRGATISWVAHADATKLTSVVQVGP